MMYKKGMGKKMVLDLAVASSMASPMQKRAYFGSEPLDIDSRCAAVSIATGTVQSGVFRTAAQVASEEAQTDEYIDIAR